MSDEIVDPVVDDTPDEGDDATELVNLAVDDGKGGKNVPLSSLIATKKEVKALNRRLRELEPMANNARSIQERLDAAQPYIAALTNNARLRAEAIREVQGGTPEPSQDGEAQEYAELHGLYLSDGVTPNASKARQMINWHDTRSRRLNEEQMRPLAGLALGQKAESNIRAALAETDTEGTPLATAESIREVAAQLPANLLADERVVELVLNNAIGVDRRKGRTPKAVDEPLYMDRVHGRRRSEPSVDADMKERLTRLGLTEKDFTGASEQLEATSQTRKGIKLGSW